MKRYTVLAAALLGTFALYVLSIGPAGALVSKLGPDDERILNAIMGFYDPVFWLLEKSPRAVNELFWSYVTLPIWGPTNPPPPPPFMLPSSPTAPE